MSGDLKEQCQHRWPDIYKALGLPETLLNRRHQPCIFCGGKDRARLTDFMGHGTYWCNQCAEGGIDGFEVLMRYTGKDFKGVADDVRKILGNTTARPQPNTDVNKARKALKKTWKETMALSKGDPVHRYLCVTRGLNKISYGDLRNLRYHPALPYFEQTEVGAKMTGKHPAMIGLVTTPDNTPATIHCTYLTADGQKADVETVRKIKPSAIEYKGGAVRLMTPSDGQVLCVAEGIETALSVKQLYPDVCPWACLNAGSMEAFCPPEYTTVMVAADADHNYTGQAAAFDLARTLVRKKHDVSVIVPELGTDFNDQIQSRGKA